MKLFTIFLLLFFLVSCTGKGESVVRNDQQEESQSGEIELTDEEIDLMEDLLSE